MPKIHLDYSDGRYYTRQLTDAEAAEHEAHGLDVTYIEDTVWETYRRDRERDGIWQAFWRSISNEQYMRRREKELQPLEDAEREIRHLKEDLAQAQRMWKHYEGEYERNLNEKHRSKWIEFTCVYPQAGCDVSALPLPWQENAEEILETFSVERAAEGLKYQGCCCGNEHLLLDDKAADKLRAAGFIVENDSESVEG
jgi:hypothetical protein